MGCELLQTDYCILVLQASRKALLNIFSLQHETTSCDLIDGMLYNNGKLTQLGEEFEAEFKDVKKYVEFIKNIITGTVPANEDIKKKFLYQVFFF